MIRRSSIPLPARQESDFVHAAHGDSSFRFYDHIDRLHKLEIGNTYSDDVMAIVGDTLSDGTELEPCSFYKGNSGGAVW